MITSFNTAYDAILRTFKSTWDAGTAPLNGGAAVPVFWPNVETNASPSAPWARITIQHNLGRQATLGRSGERQFEYQGLVIVQVFSPLGAGVAFSLNLAKIAHDAFRGRHDAVDGSVWFQNVRINEVGPDGRWYQVNVVSEFRYNIAG